MLWCAAAKKEKGGFADCCEAVGDDDGGTLLRLVRQERVQGGLHDLLALVVQRASRFVESVALAHECHPEGISTRTVLGGGKQAGTRLQGAWNAFLKATRATSLENEWLECD